MGLNLRLLNPTTTTTGKELWGGGVVFGSIAGRRVVIMGCRYHKKSTHLAGLNKSTQFVVVGVVEKTGTFRKGSVE